MTRKPPHERLSIAQIIAARNGSGGMWECPTCGCNGWKTVNSHENGGPRKRQKVCLHCGTPVRTLEVPVPDGYTLAIVPEGEFTTGSNSEDEVLTDEERRH